MKPFTPSNPRPVATFSLQPTLPRLPIPPLEETLARYLKSIQPIATAQDYERNVAFVRDFLKPGGLGHELQARLIEYDRSQTGSWLEKWWLQLAYHGWRDSCLINSNWYMIVDTPPEDVRDIVDKMDRDLNARTFTSFQLKRAAGIITRFLDYKDMLDNETLPIEMTRQGPLCMDQYRRVYGITRVPKRGCDVNVGQHPFHSRYIVVCVRDQFYKVDVIGKDGSRITLEAIEKQLAAVVEDVQANKNVQPPVGILTAQHRDTWAEVYEHLERLGDNRKTLDVIQGSLFNVSLDDYFLPKETVWLARNTFYGKGGRNRWFDKSLSLTFMADGRFGVNGEHSPCDALVPAFIIDYAGRHEPFVDPDNANKDADLNPPVKLTWTADSKILKAIDEADSYAQSLIKDSDVRLTNFADYGGTLIKKQAKVSPDAYVQMALQLTYYRIHKRLPAVYETASTRRYHHGRTETCRSLSVDSAAFLRTFEDASASKAQKVEALRKACAAHVEYIAKASNGHGVDRHMLGLRLMMREGEAWEGFKDPMFARSQHWDLSTSGLFPGPVIAGTGFGAVYPDGYGMNYIILPDKIKMGVESKVSSKETSTEKFGTTFVSVLHDMAMVLGDEKAKL